MRGAIRDARRYELMTIFSPDVAEDEIQTSIDDVLGYITAASGENVDFNRDSPWGRRRLAYPIRHESRDVRDGFYTLYRFDIAPHRVIDVEREIKLNDRIMRYLLTQYTPKTEMNQTSDQGSEGEGDEPASATSESTESTTASAAESQPAAAESAPEAAAETASADAPAETASEEEAAAPTEDTSSEEA